MDKCNICYLSVDRKTYYPCPECNNSFHRDHFAAWVFENESCPICRRKLKVKVLSELAPKTQSEAQKMREINRELAKSMRLAHKFDQKFGEKSRKKIIKEMIKQARERKPKKSLFGRLLPFIVFVVWMGGVIFVVYFT